MKGGEKRSLHKKEEGGETHRTRAPISSNTFSHGQENAAARQGRSGKTERSRAGMSGTPNRKCAENENQKSSGAPRSMTLDRATELREGD